MAQKLLFIAFCSLLAIGIKAQNNVSYWIGPTVTYNAAQLESGLQLCNLDKYRRTDHRVTMNFDDGTKVILFSADELKEKGLNINYNVVQNDKVTVLANTFLLNSEGYVFEVAKKVPTLDEQKKVIANQKKD